MSGVEAVAVDRQVEAAPPPLRRLAAASAIAAIELGPDILHVLGMGLDPGRYANRGAGRSRSEGALEVSRRFAAPEIDLSTSGSGVSAGAASGRVATKVAQLAAAQHSDVGSQARVAAIEALHAGHADSKRRCGPMFSGSTRRLGLQAVGLRRMALRCLSGALELPLRALRQTGKVPGLTLLTAPANLRIPPHAYGGVRSLGQPNRDNPPPCNRMRSPQPTAAEALRMAATKKQQGFPQGAQIFVLHPGEDSEKLRRFGLGC